MVAVRLKGELGDASCDTRRLHRTTGLPGALPPWTDPLSPGCPESPALQLPLDVVIRGCVCDADPCRKGCGAGRSAVVISVWEPMLIRTADAEADCMAGDACLIAGAIASVGDVPPCLAGDAGTEAIGCVATSCVLTRSAAALVLSSAACRRGFSRARRNMASEFQPPPRPARRQNLSLQYKYVAALDFKRATSCRCMKTHGAEVTTLTVMWCMGEGTTDSDSPGSSKGDR